MAESKEQLEDSGGSVGFRGTMAPRLENFTQLEGREITVEREPADPRYHWKANLTHAAWGKAMVCCLRNLPPLPPELVAHDSRLTDEDRAAALGAGTMVSVMTPQERPLRDRKKLLRFLNLMMGDDGVIALDHVSQKFWSRDALAEELQHDADLDIESMFVAHCIFDPAAPAGEGDSPPIHWFHTHGLAQIGGLDFDILRPSPVIGENGWDAIRAIAYILLDKGRATAGQEIQAISPGSPIAFVPVEQFNRSASAADKALRDRDETHNQDRVILCDPLKKRMFGLLPARATPSRTMSNLDGERMLAMFPTMATKLMASRAQQTVHLFQKMAEEFAEFQVKPLAKLGLPTDDDPEELEHMWFEVHAVGKDSLDGTLLNSPFQTSKIAAGDRRTHGVETMTDWMIFTPAGAISPRNMMPARLLRAHGDDIRRAMAKA